MAKHHELLLWSKVPPLQNDSEKGDQFFVWDMSEGDTDGSIPSGIRFDSKLSDYGIGFDLDVASRFTQISPILWPGFYKIFASCRRNFDGCYTVWGLVHFYMYATHFSEFNVWDGFWYNPITTVLALVYRIQRYNQFSELFINPSQELVVNKIEFWLN